MQWNPGSIFLEVSEHRCTEPCRNPGAREVGKT